MSRAVPIAASVVLHASIAVGLVASAGGHARARAGAPAVALEVDLETAEPVIAAAPEPVAPTAKAEHDDPPATHTHPYPVAPSHDAHPHDPSSHHEESHHEEAHHEESHAAPVPVGEAAAAAPALTAESGSTLPRFTIASGSGGTSGPHVPAGGSGSGAGAGGTSLEDVIVPTSSVQVAARPVQVVKPVYPAFARADDLEGEVVVEIVVDREGRVVDARVSRPAGHGFDEAALAAIRAYRFSPAQREGHPVRVRMPWTVQFRLR